VPELFLSLLLNIKRLIYLKFIIFLKIEEEERILHSFHRPPLTTMAGRGTKAQQQKQQKQKQKQERQRFSPLGFKKL
jgi:hypothetical protein